jgi:hypothetical protein
MPQQHYVRLVTAAQGGLEVLDVLIETLRLEPLKEDPRIKALRGVLADIAIDEAVHKASIESVKCVVCKQFLPHSYFSHSQEGVVLKVCSKECLDKVPTMLNEAIFKAAMLKTRPIDTLAQDQKELHAEYAEIVSKNLWELV